MELDNYVRAFAVDIGKGLLSAGQVADYKVMEEKRDKVLNAYIKDNTPAPITIEFSEKTDPNIAKLLNTYCNKFPDTKKKNIVMLGATGTGKTYCAKVIADKLKIMKEYSVHFTSAYNLIKRMRENSFGADTQTDIDFFATDLLIIDDLGAEPDHKNSDEYLYTVLSERYENDKSMIITTNLSTEQILNKYDQRIAGRIFDKNKTAVIKFEGEDIRI
jgi:DNA replication protein DnaC